MAIDLAVLLLWIIVMDWLDNAKVYSQQLDL